MVDFSLLVPKGIVSARFRRSWRGKAILQVKRQVVSINSCGEEKPAGESAWKDVDTSNIDEAHEVIDHLRRADVPV